jgi:hypothetical protein
MFCVIQLSDKNLYFGPKLKLYYFFLPSWYADIYSASKVFLYFPHFEKNFLFLYIFKSYLHIFQDSLSTSPPQELQLIPHSLAPSSKVNKIPKVKNLIFTCILTQEKLVSQVGISRQTYQRKTHQLFVLFVF